MSGLTAATSLRALWAALHALQYGFGISAFNGIQGAVICPRTQNQSTSGWLTDCVDISTTQFGLVVAIFTLGGLTGAVTTDTWTRQLGRVGTLRLSASSVLVGNVAVGLANGLYALMAGRIVLGFGCGLATVLVPLYLAEVAPLSMKKSLGIANQLFIVFGILIGQSLSFPFGAPLRWRWVFGISSLICCVQLIGSFFASPPEDAKVGNLATAVGEEEPLLSSRGEDEQEVLGIRGLFGSTDPAVKRGLLLVIVTQMVQQLCGISPVMYFSTGILTPIFKDYSKFIALGIIVLKIPMTLIPAFIIERLGSKPILLFSSISMSVFALLLAIGLNAPSQTLSVISIFSFVSAFSIGLGPVTWVVLPEVMPKHAVTAAGSLGLALNWSLNFIMGASFLPLQKYLAGLTGGKEEGAGEGNIFCMFAVLCALGFVGILGSYRLREKV